MHWYWSDIDRYERILIKYEQICTWLGNWRWCTDSMPRRWCTVTQRLEMVHCDSEIRHSEIGYGAYWRIWTIFTDTNIYADMDLCTDMDWYTEKVFCCLNTFKSVCICLYHLHRFKQIRAYTLQIWADTRIHISCSCLFMLEVSVTNSYLHLIIYKCFLIYTDMHRYAQIHTDMHRYGRHNSYLII